MQISVIKAENENDVRTGMARCYSVMHQLRPHVGLDEMVARVQQQMHQGYCVAYVEEGGRVVAVAGYRVGACLAWGRFLYVDDLVTDEAQRSKGFGKALLDWLAAEAKRCGCEQLHLDSGIQRKAAHRFYEREGMALGSYHYAIKL